MKTLLPPVLVACLALLGGCAGVVPIQPGSSVAAVTQSWGAPTREYALPNGGKRLEYNGGTWGAQTWMVDFDTNGKVTGSQNVRAEASFNAIQPGMTAAEVEMRLGLPSEFKAYPRQNELVWAYRYFSPFCQWFMVGMNPQNQVATSSYGPDPACDRPGFRDRF
jgi:hypothetical protein